MSQVANTATNVQGEWRFWLRLAGTLVSAVSLVSLIQHAFAVGVSPLLGEMLSFYRALTYPVFDLALFWLPFRFAGSTKDLVLLMFLIWGIQMRFFWCLPRDETRTSLLRFYVAYKVASLCMALAILYVPAKLVLGINVLSLGLESLHPHMLAILLIGLLKAPVIGYWLGGRRIAWNRTLRDTEHGRQIIARSREAGIFYTASLAVMGAAAAAVFALNYQVT